MKPERLALVSNARSIPLDEIAGGSRAPGRLRGNELLALASRGLRDPARSAFFLRWTGELGYLPVVEHALLRHAHARARRERWPEYMKGKRPYAETLVELALAEEIAPHRFMTVGDRVAWLGLSERWWHGTPHRHGRNYGAIRGVLDIWVSIACDHLNARLSGRR